MNINKPAVGISGTTPLAAYLPIACLVVAVGISMLSAVAVCGEVRISAVGQVSINSGELNPHELSGLAFAGLVNGNTYRYLAVSNTQKSVYGLDVKINMSSGAVESASVVSALPLADGTDLEGIAILDDSSIYISDEVGPAIRKYSRADGKVTGSVSVPAVLSHCNANKALEALSINKANKSIWTANEEALTVDGNIASVGNGTTIRIFKFAGDNHPAGQWAYNVDGIESAFLGKQLSGVADMAVLNDSTLLMLERELDGAGFRTRIYLADLTSATDVSGLSGLINQPYTPASKTLLWEKRFSLGNFNNYEGMSLGPKLSDGSVSLLLISDDNTNALMGQTLYALKVTGAPSNGVPEPSSLAAVATGLAGLIAAFRIKR